MATGEEMHTDMNAIRQDETLSAIHSLYVDQWDWEKVILRNERNIETLKQTVKRIDRVLKTIDRLVSKSYSSLSLKLPETITFITADDLAKKHPHLTPSQGEDAVARDHRAVFIIGIGDILENGERHDARSPDYDDWTFNGDLILWNPTSESAFELSSIGIRVDAKALASQLEKADQRERRGLNYHRLV